MKCFSRLVLALVLSFTLVQLPITKAHASSGMISTQKAVESFNRSASENNIKDFLNRSDVKDKLISLGYSPEDAQKKLASLTEAEIKTLDSDIQKATLAGDVGGILVIVLLVILIIYFAKRI